MQPISKADHIYQTLQADFDRILCDVLEKYHTIPGFTLLLGGLLQFIMNMNIKEQHTYPPGMAAYLYLVRERGEGYILYDIGLSEPGDSGIHGIAGKGTHQFLTYLTQLLENPE